MFPAWILYFSIALGLARSEYACKPASSRSLYDQCGLSGKLSYDAFKNGVDGLKRYACENGILVICDFSKPSDQERFFVLDLKAGKLLNTSLVAHGKNSGERMAEHFSNEPGSLQSSKGFFRIGEQIESPKHGAALMLEGLERGINDLARMREIIIHNADYVSQEFVCRYGRLGRSFGCPALPPGSVEALAPVLRKGSLLYIYAP